MKRNSPEFKTLQATWYKKLAKKGFDDIEQDEDKLKSWTKAAYDSRYSTYRFANEEYYRLAGHFLHEYKFESEVERFIWEQHSIGLTSRAIAEMAKKKRLRVTTNSRVHAIIKKLEKEMLKNVR